MAVGQIPPQQVSSRPGLKSVIRVLAWTRYVVALAVLGIFAGATILIFVTVVKMVQVFLQVLAVKPVEIENLRRMLIGSVDFFLVATVMYVIATGLYQLFVNRNVTPHLPPWLQISDLGDLERRLMGMVAVVASVIFLDRLMESDDGFNVLELGLGIGAVIVGCGLFMYLEAQHALLHAEKLREKGSGSGEEDV